MTHPTGDTYVLKVRGGTRMTYRNPNGSAWLLGSIADRVGNTTTIAVDASNQETSVTDPVGNVTGLTWSQGRIASVTNAEGLIWTLDYTGGQLTGIRHPAVNGATPVETLAYDAGGRHLLLTDTSPEGVAVARFEYNADGSLAASLDPEGRRTSLTSTASQVRITDAFGSVTTYNFTPAGELGESFDPSGVRMARNVYDSRHRLVSTFDWLNKETRYTSGSDGGIPQCVSVRPRIDGIPRARLSAASTGGRPSAGSGRRDGGTARLGAAAVEALHRPTPAIVVEYDLVEAIAGVAPDRAPPEGGRGGVLGALAHLPGAAEAIEQRVRGALADAVTAVAAQHEELGHVEHRGIASEAARLHDQREAG
jgi:YD repeat-containing protein